MQDTISMPPGAITVDDATLYHKPTILQVLPALNTGGVERGTVDLAHYLCREGYESIVASSGGAMLAELYDSASKHYTLPLNTKNPFKIFSNINKLAEIIENNDVDIVHARSRAPAWSAYYAAKKTNKYFVTTFHGIYKINSNLKRYYNAIMTKGDYVIATSNFTKQHILQNYGVDESKIIVIHRGINVDFLNPNIVHNDRVTQLLDKVGIKKDRPVITLPGRMTRWKGQDFLIDAISKLNDLSFYCLLVGNWRGHEDYYNELVNKIENYNLSNKVKLVENIFDMPALYKLSDIVVSSSIEPESFGRTIVEAMAMGNIVVAANHGGASETVLDGKTGYLFANRDIDDLENKLRKALSLSETEKDNTAQIARTHVENNFSLKSMCQKTCDLYNILLNKHE